MTDEFQATINSVEVITNGRTSDPGVENTLPASDTSGVQAQFASFIDTGTRAIGRVVGSEKEPAGAHKFYFWASDDAVSLDVGHIVVAFSEEAAVIGVVDEPRRYSDLQSFLDDYYDRHVEIALEDEPPTKRPQILVFSVNVLATNHFRSDVDSHRPPVAGPVYYATKEAIAFALDREGFDGEPIPALMHVNGNAERNDDATEKLDETGNVVFQRSPIWLDEDYLLGPEAGHANWTGQSGLATKTSHALFLTSAVFQTLAKKGTSVSALMFNVKGPDLLWLDKPALPDTPQLEAAYKAADFKGLSGGDVEAYAALGLEPKPFEGLRIFAPFKPTLQPYADGNGTVRLQSVLTKQNLNTLRTNSNEVACICPILLQLGDLLFQPHKVFDRSDWDDMFFGFIAELRDVLNVRSIKDLDKVGEEITTWFESEDKPDRWRGHHKATILKTMNRLKGLMTKFGGLLCDGTVEYGSLPKVDEPFKDQEVRVVDIAHCNSNVQELIVSNVIYDLWKLAEKDQLGVKKVIVFVDELNKYAPAGGQGSLRETLVDIAARGRHLNVVLFGAQQFRSKVDDEILGNCGTSLYGRVGDEEIVNSAYRSLSETQKAELLGLRKGRLLIRHAHFRSPLFGSFPMPPTIPGTIGSKVFNGGQAGVVVDGSAGMGLYFMLKRAMKNGYPSINEVLNEVRGVDDETIVWITEKVEQRCQEIKGTSAETRVNAWKMARDHISKARS